MSASNLTNVEIQEISLSLSLSYSPRAPFASLCSLMETMFRFTCGYLISLVNFVLRCNTLYERNRVTRAAAFFLRLSLFLCPRLSHRRAIFPRASKRAITFHFVLRVFRIAQRCVYAVRASKPVWTNSVWTEFWNCVFKSDRTSSQHKSIGFIGFWCGLNNSSFDILRHWYFTTLIAIFI